MDKKESILEKGKKIRGLFCNVLQIRPQIVK